MKKLIIAIDGPAASGKGTLAKLLAERLHLAHLDTGSLYRAVAFCLDALHFTVEDVLKTPDVLNKIEESKLIEVSHTDLIRTESIGKLASDFSQVPAVRSFLNQFQKDFAYHPPKPFEGAVLDGRDIGTVICPDASFKFFVTASAEVRAQRRYKELKSQGKDVRLESILLEVESRDAADRNRSVAPLLPAEDAIYVDSSKMSIEACLNFCLDLIQKHDEL